MNQVVKEVIPTEYFDANTIVHINPCGLFIIGGPMVSAIQATWKWRQLINFNIVHRVMLVWLDVKLSSTHMAVGVRMVVVLSLVKISQKLIVQPPMLLDGLPSHWLRLAFAVVALCRSRTLSVSLNLFQSLYSIMARRPNLRRNCCLSFAITLICVLVWLWSKYLCQW